ncbi:hypothetical protein FBZ87_103510 [Nitrospirillum amazonense]|uniref:Uncharacterized protein n=1 Tax=Nitrospirillum amazonense TaxID=28077 RepID=A0A560K304_9PROT|nr:hypothetical protein [Nitrospirillum amazonense]TWB77691.1 hypothetical protein FBZ87_103510 [Nitrospirillum amazonense]
MDGWQRRYRLSNGPGGLGLSCTAEGVGLAGVPLLVKGAGGFQARPAAEVAVLLRRAYAGVEPGAAVLPGLTKIADALNRGDLAQAMIRAVHLRLPDLDWDAAVRLARANDNLVKYSPDQPRDWHGRWASGGGGETQAKSPRDGLAVSVSYQPQAQGAKKKGGVIPVMASTIPSPKEAERIFNEQIRDLREKGILPTQNKIMGNLFPDFVFQPVYAVLYLDDSVHKFATLKEAQRDAAKYPEERRIVGGNTNGNRSEIYMTAAGESEIPGLGSTSREQTMRFVIMHEWGHHSQGGGCTSPDANEREICADDFSLHHQGTENGHR